MLNNLRQLAAASVQFVLDNGRAATSLDELVGVTKYIRALNAVDGESYAGLSYAQRQKFTVTSASGITVVYDPAGGTTTQVPNLAPEEVFALEALFDRTHRVRSGRELQAVEPEFVDRAGALVDDPLDGA